MAIIKLYFSIVFLWKFTQKNDHGDPLKNSMRMNSVQVKLLHIKPGSRLSLQYHHKRKEFWKIVKGSATVQVQNKQSSLKEGDDIIIPSGAKHQDSSE